MHPADRTPPQTDLVALSEVRAELKRLSTTLNALSSAETDDFTRYQLEEAGRNIASARSYLSEAQYDIVQLSKELTSSRE